MFNPLVTRDEKQRSWSLAGSLLFHAGLLFWLLHPASPVFVRPSGVRHGERGTSLSPVYLTRNGREDSDGRLTLQKPQAPPAERSATQLRSPHASDRKPSQHKLLEAQKEQESLASLHNGADQAKSAGSPLGSLSEGPATGQEVRPALPVFGPQPDVAPSELPQGVAGDVVAEITIDEQGNVTRVILVQPIGYGIDEKVLAILPRWHFKPATRDGVAIASQQDVYFHFANIAR
jgi:TonB family protein